MAHGASNSFVAKAIYGLITVLSVLLVMEEHPPTPGRAALLLFGTTLAVALVDTYAETISEMLSHQRRLARTELRAIWRDVSPVLVGAQAPTFVMVLSALGFYSVERAITIAKVVIVLFLFRYGLRVGQLLHQDSFRRLMSGLLAVAIAGVIVGIKVAFH